MNTLWYLAAPYTIHPGGIGMAFIDATAACAYLLKNGVVAFSPITHSHPLAIYGNIDPLSHDIWMAADAPFMNKADGLIILRLPGLDYTTSAGISKERKHFSECGKPELWMEPGTMPEGMSDWL